MPTTNLNIPDISSSQSQKEVTANQAHDKLDLALTDLEAIAFSDADFTLTSPQALENMIFNCTGTLTALRNLIVPTNKKLYIVINATGGGFGITVKTSAGTGITVANGATRILYCDGTNVIAIT